MELADEAFAAACQTEISGGVCLGLRERSRFSRGFRAKHGGAMFMSGCNRGPVDNETEQQDR